MKNNLKLKRAVSAFSIAIILISQTAPVFAETIQATTSSEAAQIEQTIPSEELFLEPSVMESVAEAPVPESVEEIPVVEEAVEEIVEVVEEAPMPEVEVIEEVPIPNVEETPIVEEPLPSASEELPVSPDTTDSVSVEEPAITDSTSVPVENEVPAVTEEPAATDSTNSDDSSVHDEPSTTDSTVATDSTDSTKTTDSSTVDSSTSSSTTSSGSQDSSATDASKQPTEPKDTRPEQPKKEPSKSQNPKKEPTKSENKKSENKKSDGSGKTDATLDKEEQSKDAPEVEKEATEETDSANVFAEHTTTPVFIGPSISSIGSSLDSRLLTLGIAASDLNGFELPVLSSFKDQRSAALVVEALKQLKAPYKKDAKGPDEFDNLHFPVYVYEKVFGTKLGNNYEEVGASNTEIKVEDAVPGDLLVWKEAGKVTKLAIYLGQNKFIMADDTLLKEHEEAEKEEKEKEEIPGVRVFNLHLENDEDDEETDLLGQYDAVAKPTAAIHFSDDLKLTTHGKDLLKSYAATITFGENASTQRFVEEIGESARELGLKYDVFASVMIAQAVLESGSGSSGLSSGPYYNLFGVKGSHGGSSVTLATNEDDGSGRLYQIQSAFRVYPSYKESLEDYVQLIRNGISGNKEYYKKTWRSVAGNYLQATAALTGKYATDTQYHNKLNSIIAAYNLTRFDEPKVEASLSVRALADIPEVYRSKVKYPKYNGVNYNVSGSYGADQCTWYVFNRVHQLGGTVDDYMGNGADWGTTGRRLGYKTSSTPKAGYVISFKQGVAGYHPLYGHVGFVEAVGLDGILISEGDASYLSYRVIPNEIALSSGVSYVAPQ